MPIPKIKYDNLNGYGRILTIDHESRKNICIISYITNSLLIGQDFPRKERTLVMRKPSCNTQKDSESFLSLSPPCDFSHSGFSRKNSYLRLFADWIFTFRIILANPLPCFKYRPSRLRYRPISPFLPVVDTIWGNHSTYHSQQKMIDI